MLALKGFLKHIYVLELLMEGIPRSSDVKMT